MLAGMAGIGWWVSEQIKNRVIDESAVTSALYMDSFIAPNVQELAFSRDISARHVAVLNNLLRETDLGQRLVAFKIWGNDGNILYNKGSDLLPDIPPSDVDTMRVWQGEVVAGLNDSEAALNNAYRHANGAAQKVQVKNYDGYMHIDWDKHLGLSGMRERVESLGGRFQIESKTGQGTKVIAQLPLRTSGEQTHG